MTGFVLLFFHYHKFPQPYLKLIIYCVDADVPNICLYCDSVLRQVEQEKMQQTADVDAIRSVHCDSTRTCTVKQGLNFSEF